MNIAIDSDGTYISLCEYKEHFTLYSRDLQEFINKVDTAEDLFYKIDDYLRDVLPDEGHPNWTWKSSELKKACKKVYKTLKS